MNTIEKWVQWKPIKGLANKYYIESISDDVTGFRILFSESSNDKNKFLVTFKNSVDSYIRTDESYRFKLIDDLGEHYGTDFYGDWTFFKVLNSSYLQWLSIQSYELSDTRDFIHFSFIAVDSVLDVVTNYEPEVKIINE